MGCPERNCSNALNLAVPWKRAENASILQHGVLVPAPQPPPTRVALWRQRKRVNPRHKVEVNGKYAAKDNPEGPPAEEQTRFYGAVSDASVETGAGGKPLLASRLDREYWCSLEVPPSRQELDQPSCYELAVNQRGHIVIDEAGALD